MRYQCSLLRKVQVESAASHGVRLRLELAAGLHSSGHLARASVGDACKGASLLCRGADGVVHCPTSRCHRSKLQPEGLRGHRPSIISQFGDFDYPSTVWLLARRQLIPFVDFDPSRHRHSIEKAPTPLRRGSRQLRWARRSAALFERELRWPLVAEPARQLRRPRRVPNIRGESDYATVYRTKRR